MYVFEVNVPPTYHVVTPFEFHNMLPCTKRASKEQLQEKGTKTPATSGLHLEDKKYTQQLCDILLDEYRIAFNSSPRTNACRQRSIPQLQTPTCLVDGPRQVSDIYCGASLGLDLRRNLCTPPLDDHRSSAQFLAIHLYTRKATKG